MRKSYGEGHLPLEFYPEDLKDRLSERLYRVFGKPERAFQSLWEWACCGENDRLAEYYENGGKLDLRYEAFGKFHSLIMGALRNRNYDTVEYLLSKGETVTESEREELKKYYAEKLVDAAEKLTDYFSYHNKNLTCKQYELFDDLADIVKVLKKC